MLKVTLLNKCFHGSLVFLEKGVITLFILNKNYKIKVMFEKVLCVVRSVMGPRKVSAEEEQWQAACGDAHLISARVDREGWKSGRLSCRARWNQPRLQ